MAHAVVWSAAAVEDLESIAEHISRDSAAYDAAVIRNIIESTRRLTKFPESGRIVPELNDRSTREVIAHGYRVIYRLQEEHVLVITVLHGRRRLPLVE